MAIKPTYIQNGSKNIIGSHEGLSTMK